MGRKTGKDALFRPVRDEIAFKTFDGYPYIVPTAQGILGPPNIPKLVLVRAIAKW